MTLSDIAKRFYSRFPKLPILVPFHKVEDQGQLKSTNAALGKTIESLKSRLMLPPIATQVALGKSFDEAIVAFARSASDESDRVIARSFFQALTLDENHKDIGAIAFGVLLARVGLYDSAHHYFNQAKPGLAQEVAAYEYFDSACFIDSAEGFKALESFIESNRTRLSAADLMGLMRLLGKFRRVEALAKETQLLIAANPTLNADDAKQLAWFQAQLNHTDEVADSAPGVINVAVMDYKMLDRSRSSGNRGDYVQTLAALSNLLRFKNVEYVGDSKLSNYLNNLKLQVHKERQIDGPKVKVQPVPLDRDFSSGRIYPEKTWLISNGWFMRRNFAGPVDFPYPKNVLPLMISFHIQDPDVLTEEVVTELKRIEPIGCRDWTTVYRLRDFGIKAFFSGCVTTTVGQILTPATNTSAKKLALVETPLNRSKYGGWQVDNFIQVGEQVRDFDLVEGIEDARTMLEGYADYQVVATSRLHCYLPARSMGLKVDFTPKNFSDVRFEGLLNLDETAFGKIRKGIEDKLEITLAAIFDGKSEAEVRKLWADICAEEVAEADKYATTFSKSTKSAIDVPSAVATLEASKTPVNNNPRDNTAVETAFALDQNLEHMFPVVMQSLVDHTKRQITAHVMTRGLGEEFRTRMGKLFPEVNFFFYSFDSVDYGKAVNLLSHISVSTMDRLFLPEILKHLKKVLYLDIDILIQGDVGELYDVELGSNVFAGKRTRLKSWANMIRPITRATLHLPPAKAWDIRKRLHDEADLTSRTFNAGILVINLELMRSENFTAEHLYLVEECRMNDQDVFNIYSKDRVVQIGTEWNHVPAQDFNSTPKIIHWAGPAKPWKPEYVLLKERYVATEAKVLARLKG